MSSNLHPMLNVAIKAARAAGALINRAALDVEAVRISQKQINDFVTEVDHAAERAIIETLLTAYPGHGILAEESGSEHGAKHSDYVWIIDPLDGTREPEPGIVAGITPEFYNDLTTIIYANIPDNNPGIRFISLAPNAGWAPAAYEQLSDTYMRTSALRKISLGDPDRSPSDYLRKYFWYVTQDDRTVLLNAGYMGEAHLIWGSFAFMPDASVWPATRQLFERVTSGLDRSLAARVAGDNAQRLYHLGNARPFTPEEIDGFDSYAML